MSRRDYILQLVTGIVGDASVATEVLERLQEEGVLHLGYGDAEVDGVLEAFAATFGTTKASRHDRYAASRLVKRYGSPAIVGIIKLLGERSQDRYAPVVRSVSDLENKIVSVLRFLRKQSGEETIAV